MSLNVTRFKLAEYHRSTYACMVEHGTAPGQLVEPAFWAHVASSLKPGDIIQVEPDSREWFAELYVLESGMNFARVALLSVSPLVDTNRPAVDESDADFSVDWKGPAKKWSVIRTADKAYVYEGLPSKDAALAKLAAHVRPQAA